MIKTTQTENTKAHYAKLVEEHIIEAARAFRAARMVEARGDDPEYVEDLRVEAQFETENAFAAHEKASFARALTIN